VYIKDRFLAVIISAVGISLVGHALAFLRQLLVAAFFGISRELDIYLVVFAVATMVVFTFGIIFDSVAVPRLVQLRQSEGDEAFKNLATAIFSLSCGLGVIVNLAMLAAIPLLAPIVATGFDSSERSELMNLVWYFLPWTLLYLPYYSIAAQHKGKRNFNRVFAAEIFIGIVSVCCFVVWHEDIRALPLAYAAGYAAGLLSLVPGAELQRTISWRRESALRMVIRNIGEMYLANQTGNMANVVDRHFQSMLPPGGIAAVSYSAQVVNTISGLLTFREVYIVPLSEIEGRSERLERLVIGLLLVAVPIAVFTVVFAHEIVTILFQRGQFNLAAAELTSSVLQVYGLVLIPSSVANPLFRMFQVIDRIWFTYVAYLISAIFLGAAGFLFISALKLGAAGIAWMTVTNSVFGCCVVIYLLARVGLSLSWQRVGGYFLFALAVAVSACVIALVATLPVTHAWVRVLLGGTTFSATVAAFYFLARSQLHSIIQ
jgi:putative peptidoglycan lipid II flippase